MEDVVNVMSTGTVVLSPTRAKASTLQPGDELLSLFNPTSNPFVHNQVEPDEPEPTVDQPSLDDDW